MIKRGHRRTQSATISLNNHFHVAEQAKAMKPQAKESEITQLLTKSINRVKEKVCTIDQLHVKLDEEKLGMFNFGKGLIKPYLPMRATHEEQLGSIPEKLKQPSKSKRAPENGNPSIKKRKALHCLARPKTPFNLSKIGDEKLSSKCQSSKKQSFVDSQSRTYWHKKQSSSIK